MKELLQNENIRKCIKLFAVSLGVILVIKYLLPLFWPFVLAYFLGELVCRLSDFLNRKLQFHYKVAAIFSLVVIVILIFVLLALIINKLLGQVQNLVVSWPKFQNDEVKMHLAFTNSIGENAIDNEEIAFLLLKFLIENYKTKLEKRYDIKIETFSNDNEYTIEIRDQIALKKGCIMSGGKIDETKVSNMILNDFRSGKLGKISLEKPLNS